jgi:hypothetical protein
MHPLCQETPSGPLYIQYDERAGRLGHWDAAAQGSATETSTAPRVDLDEDDHLASPSWVATPDQPRASRNLHSANVVPAHGSSVVVHLRAQISRLEDQIRRIDDSSLSPADLQQDSSRVGKSHGLQNTRSLLALVCEISVFSENVLPSFSSKTFPISHVHIPQPYFLNYGLTAYTIVVSRRHGLCELAPSRFPVSK